MQLQDAVTTSQETSDAFSDETLREHAVFEYAKRDEMKEMLERVADGQIELYKQVCFIPTITFCRDVYTLSL